MRNPASPHAVVHLDKKRRMALDLNAMVAFEEATGKQVQELGAGMSMSDMRVLLWACLLTDDPDVTLEQTGAFIHIKNLEKVSGILQNLYTDSAPDTKDLPDASEETEAEVEIKN